MSLQRTLITNTLFGVLSIALLSGCGKMTTQKILQEVNNGQLQKLDRPVCEVYSAEYALETDIIALQMEDNFGIEMGFDIFKDFFKLFKIGFSTKSGKLDLAMTVYDPLRPEVDLVNERGGAKLRKNEFKFEFDFWKIDADVHYLKQTPFNKLSSNALKDVMNDVRNTMNRLEDSWKTKIVAIPNGYEVIIPVGSFANIKLGDRFNVYNVEHIWEGAPCQSRYLLAKHTPVTPIATAVVTQVENNASVLSIESRDGNDLDTTTDGLRVGSEVEVLQLMDRDRQLYRALQIQTITGGELEFEQGHIVDISPFVKSQIQSVIHEYGFYVYDQKNIGHIR